MEESKELNPRGCSTFEMTTYSLGSCTESLVLNTIGGFAILYYTKSLGISAAWAGVAMSASSLWDGIVDPIIGHISDNTRSRFGKRFPYMLLGGILMVLCFFFLWYVPASFKTDWVIGSIKIPAMSILIGYLIIMNLLLRTTYAVFVIPYTALGFEICQDYSGRSKLQGIRMALSMAANLLGPAMAWVIWFPDKGKIKDTQIAQNYINMGMVFTIASFVFLLLMLAFMAKYIKDSRQDTSCHGSLMAFFENIKDIILDKYIRWVFVFMCFISLGVTLIGNLQMFVFDDFMQLNGGQKSIAHGATMVFMMLGSLSLVYFVRRFDKKGAIYIAVAWSVLCELLLAALFLTGFIKPGQMLAGFPIAFVLFAFFHGAYWFGNGILLPTAFSMIADISEINRIKSGVNKDASYAAVYSLGMKMATAAAFLVVGFCIDWTGFQSGADAVQTPESMWRVCALTFVAGPLAQLLALAVICRYPVTKVFIEEMRSEAAV
jgi:glycoside/pentoside/hexuronide:cation symporter, GPH family